MSAVRLICPHCHSRVRHGEVVCPGCQADVRYGIPSVWVLVILALSAWVAIKAAPLFDDPLLGWGIGVALFLGSVFALSRTFRDRVAFKRPYRMR